MQRRAAPLAGIGNKRASLLGQTRPMPSNPGLAVCSYAKSVNKGQLRTEAPITFAYSTPLDNEGRYLE